MAKLSKTNKYSILWLAYQEKSVEEISKELSLPETTIKNLLEKENTTNKDSKKLTGSEPVKAKNRIKNLMIHNTLGKKDKNVTIMTKEAAEVIEAVQKKRKKKARNEDNIFRPNG
jgi:hypothetical protein